MKHESNAPLQAEFKSTQRHREESCLTRSPSDHVRRAHPTPGHRHQAWRAPP